MKQALRFTATDNFSQCHIVLETSRREMTCLLLCERVCVYASVCVYPEGETSNSVQTVTQLVPKLTVKTNFIESLIVCVMKYLVYIYICRIDTSDSYVYYSSLFR
jgi:hypothetical protein